MGRTPWNRNPHRDRLRAYVIRRDDGICWICGGRGATTVDHLTPRSLGGSDDPSNLAAAHAHCNYSRGAAPPARPFTSRTY
jgi:5-methylcytosine-specific restriction endonuclease McrA